MQVTERPPTHDAAADSRGAAGVVLVHGFNGTPGDMTELARRLTEHGYQTHLVQLPGHTGELRELVTATWADWFATAHGATERMRLRCERVVVVGHSLGGALALATAAAEPELAGVVSLCPPCQLRRGLPEMVDVLRRFIPYVPAMRYDVSGSLAERWRVRKTHAYDWIPLRTVHSLFSGLKDLREQLPCVTSPALVMCARYDHVVPMEDGVEAYLRLGSARKELLVLSRSRHLVLQDRQRELVMERIVRFCAQVAPVPPTHPLPAHRQHSNLS